MEIFTVKYSGTFGFIKPWTAVRDSETFSQQFLTPSIIEGIRQKLEVKAIIRHKLTYESINLQQEVTHTRAWKYNSKAKMHRRDRSIISRGVLINPDLFLGFENERDAQKAYREHVCLARNEDVLLPSQYLGKLKKVQFDQIHGFELRFEQNEESFIVGYNRFEDNIPMYGWLDVGDKPLKSQRR